MVDADAVVIVDHVYDQNGYWDMTLLINTTYYSIDCFGLEDPVWISVGVPNNDNYDAHSVFQMYHNDQTIHFETYREVEGAAFHDYARILEDPTVWVMQALL